MPHLPPSVAVNAHRQLDRFAETLIEGGLSGPSLMQRIEEMASTIVADLHEAGAPDDLIADVMRERDRAKFLVELVYWRLREIEDAVCAPVRIE